MDTHEEQSVIRLWLGFALIASILALIILEPMHGPWWLNLIIKLIEAVAIASVIGVFIDVALKREMSREVFFASVGYVLTPELRPEMRWLCQLNELCTQDTLVCTLTPLEPDSMRLRVQRTQVVKNIGREAHELKVGIGIDEWFQSKTKSSILKYSFVTKSESWPPDGRLLPDHIQKSEFGLTTSKAVPLVLLGKDEQVTIISEFEEIYPRNGYFHMHIKYATSGARVTVNSPDNFGVYVHFTHREGHETLRVGHDYVCPFTLLPYQRIGIRFWDKQQSEEWRKSA